MLGLGVQIPGLPAQRKFVSERFQPFLLFCKNVNAIFYYYQYPSTCKKLLKSDQSLKTYNQTVINS